MKFSRELFAGLVRHFLFLQQIHMQWGQGSGFVVKVSTYQEGSLLDRSLDALDDASNAVGLHEQGGSAEHCGRKTGSPLEGSSIDSGTCTSLALRFPPDTASGGKPPTGAREGGTPLS